MYMNHIRSESGKTEIDEILNMMREGLLIVSRKITEQKQKIIFQNQAFKKMMGSKNDDSISNSFARVANL